MTKENAAAFALEDVVAHYPCRPPYPKSIVDRLQTDGVLLEIGCGTAELSRRLAPHARGIDAVDPSEAMLRMAKTQPGGDAPNIRWHHATGEAFAYPRRYDLILAPQSLHWMDWDVVFPKFAAVADRIAILQSSGFRGAAWHDAVRKLVPAHSLMRHFDFYDLFAELERRGFIEIEEMFDAPPEPFRQTVDAYVGSWWSRAGFARERLGPDRSAAFETAVRETIAPHVQDCFVEGAVTADLCLAKIACDTADA